MNPKITYLLKYEFKLKLHKTK